MIKWDRKERREDIVESWENKTPYYMMKIEHYGSDFFSWYIENIMQIDGDDQPRGMSPGMIWRTTGISASFEKATDDIEAVLKFLESWHKKFYQDYGK